MIVKPERQGRELLLEVARDAFLAHGYANVSMQQLAEAAGMTKGAPYYHFKSKDDLFLTIFIREIVRLKDGLIAKMQGQGDFRQRLKAGVAYVIETTQGDFNQLFTDFERNFQHEAHDAHDKDNIDLYQAMLSYFEAARADGTFTRLPADSACRYFMLMLFGQMKFVGYEKMRPELYKTPTEHANGLIDLLFEGI